MAPCLCCRYTCDTKNKLLLSLIAALTYICGLQGLGKTVTTIALILSAPAPNMIPSAGPAPSESGSSSGAESLEDQSSDLGRTDDGVLEDTTDSSDGDEEVDADDSLAAKDPWEKGPLRGGTLVVVPTSVLHQWHQELRDKVATSAGE